MRFALSLAFSDPAEYCELARVAERNGFHSVVVSDHVVHPETLATPYPYTPDGRPRWEPSAPWPDPWVAIGAMAGATRSLHFVTGVYVLPMRNPFQVAKAVATAAQVSNYRVALGVGVGWMREEFHLMEQPFEGRGARMDEMLEVMRKLWTGEMVEHHGRHYDFDRIQMSPGVTGPIPIYGGGVSEPALRRVGRIADGWISDLHTTSELREIIARIRRHRAEFGREAEPLEIIAACSDAAGVDGYRRLADAGVTQALSMPWVFYSGTSQRLEDKLAGIARFSGDVIEKLAPRAG